MLLSISAKQSWPTVWWGYCCTWTWDIWDEIFLSSVAVNTTHGSIMGLCCSMLNFSRHLGLTNSNSAILNSMYLLWLWLHTGTSHTYRESLSPRRDAWLQHKYSHSNSTYISPFLDMVSFSIWQLVVNVLYWLPKFCWSPYLHSADSETLSVAAC